MNTIWETYKCKKCGTECNGWVDQEDPESNPKYDRLCIMCKILKIYGAYGGTYKMPEKDKSS
jgi:hypothetical protein